MTTMSVTSPMVSVSPATSIKRRAASGRVPGRGPRLLPPALALVAAVSAVLFWPTLQPRIEAAFGGAAAGRIAAVPNAAAWLAAAWFGARLVDAGIARAARQGHAGPAPRLLADLAYAFLFGLAGLQILGFVLERSVTGLVATSGVLIAVLGFAVRNM